MKNLLVLVIALSVLGACKKDDSSTTNTQEQQQKQQSQDQSVKAALVEPFDCKAISSFSHKYQLDDELSKLGDAVIVIRNKYEEPTISQEDLAILLEKYAQINKCRNELTAQQNSVPEGKDAWQAERPQEPCANDNVRITKDLLQKSEEQIEALRVKIADPKIQLADFRKVLDEHEQLKNCKKRDVNKSFMQE